MIDDDRDPQTHAIIGAAMEVHSFLGNGFLEPVYHEALSTEFRLRSIPFQHEAQLAVHYKHFTLRKTYSCDSLCFADIIVELKAHNTEFSGADRSQVVNYLKTSGCRRALLLNFGTPALKYERLVWGYTPRRLRGD